MYKNKGNVNWPIVIGEIILIAIEIIKEMKAKQRSKAHKKHK